MPWREVIVIFVFFSLILYCIYVTKKYYIVRKELPLSLSLAFRKSNLELGDYGFIDSRFEFNFLKSEYSISNDGLGPYVVTKIEGKVDSYPHWESILVHLDDDMLNIYIYEHMYFETLKKISHSLNYCNNFRITIHKLSSRDSMLIQVAKIKNTKMIREMMES